MVHSLIGITDLFLVPGYFLIFFIGAYFYKKKNIEDLLVKKYFLKGFVFKIGGGLIYAVLVVYYWGFGDTATYFIEVLQIKALIANGQVSFFQTLLSDYSLFRNDFKIYSIGTNSGFLITKFALVVSYLTFDRFLVTTMVFSVFAYTSLFLLFKTFVSLLPKMHFIIALFILFFPSISIYGSGILKDTVCITALGYLFYAIYNLFVLSRIKLKYMFICLTSVYIIIIVKSYILAAFLLPFFIFSIAKFIGNLKPVNRTISLFLICIVFGGLVFVFAPVIEEFLGNYSASKIQESVQSLQNIYSSMTDNADSNFSLGTIEPTLFGLIKKMPAGLVATLYRPFLWEAKTVFSFCSALESLFILLFTLFVLFKVGLFRTIKIIISNPLIFLFIGFSIIFASLVGLSALNFGTLARYRIPVLPFYLVGMLLIHSKSKEKMEVNIK